MLVMMTILCTCAYNYIHPPVTKHRCGKIHLVDLPGFHGMGISQPAMVTTVTMVAMAIGISDVTTAHLLAR